MSLFPSSNHAWVLALIDSVPVGEDLSLETIAASTNISVDQVVVIVTWLETSGYLLSTDAGLAIRTQPTPLNQTFTNLIL